MCCAPSACRCEGRHRRRGAVGVASARRFVLSCALAGPVTSPCAAAASGAGAASNGGPLAFPPRLAPLFPHPPARRSRSPSPPPIPRRAAALLPFQLPRTAPLPFRVPSRPLSRSAFFVSSLISAPISLARAPLLAYTPLGGQTPAAGSAAAPTPKQLVPATPLLPPTALLRQTNKVLARTRPPIPARGAPPPSLSLHAPSTQPSCCFSSRAAPLQHSPPQPPRLPTAHQQQRSKRSRGAVSSRGGRPKTVSRQFKVRRPLHTRGTAATAPPAGLLGPARATPGAQMRRPSS